jgi:hypothetical protein
MTVDLSTRGKRLRWARRCAGYRTAKAFYQKFGIDQGTYSGHESDGRGIRPDVAQEYATHLENCSPEWILYGQGEPPQPLDAGNPGDPQVFHPITAKVRREEEEQAFALLYNGLLQVTQENDEAILREFGVVLERYGFEGNLKGVGRLAFHLFREAQEEGGVIPLMERASQRVTWLQEAMNDLKESLRKMGRLIGPEGR